jgi:alpha-mannosidase
MDMYFELAIADIVVPNIQARQLWVDFRVLAQVAKAAAEMKASALPAKALHACNEIMSAFRRIDGDEEDLSLLDDTIKRCRDIAREVLGRLDEEGLSKTAPHADTGKDAKIWAIGHWQVAARACDCC